MTTDNAVWYQRTRRWGQTNLTEIDPLHYDSDFWRDHWRRTRVQGIIVNAGGIVAYYPSRFRDHYRAEHLGQRDLFGEIIAAAREDGLAVLARMDSNRATEAVYQAHPDWFAVDTQGQPSVTQGRYQACVNSPYYKELLPDILREIIERYHPDGFTDNSWTGMKRNFICHCPHCREKFRADTGRELPTAPDWTDETYRHWIRWSYDCRLANWVLNNEVTRAAGGPDCLWLGMVNANPIGSHLSFCDLKAVGERSLIMMCDHQSRDALNGFEQNSLNGKLLHDLAGWETVIPESMAHYVRGIRAFRRGSNPPQEAGLWITEGMAGGISPWWHHIGARQEDRRQFETSVQLMRWHDKNEVYLYDRQPVANVGLVWNQDSIEFYGREAAHERVALPWRGFTQALTRARIPFIPLHADHISREAANLDLLILPNLAAMSESQCQSVADFVAAGGNLLFSGNTACLDEWGEPRVTFPLAEATGIRHLNDTQGYSGTDPASWEVFAAHNYLRLPAAKDRHPIVGGFAETDILPFGGLLHRVEGAAWQEAVATYIPAFPIYPPEFSWMRQEETDIPALLAGQSPTGGRVVYLAGDVDRCYGRARLPDHGDLLAKAINWAVDEKLPLKVSGPGYLDCNLYRQAGRLILHLINLSGANQWPGYVEQYLPVGPLTVSVALDGLQPRRAFLRVRERDLIPQIEDGWATIELDELTHHELIVLE